MNLISIELIDKKHTRHIIDRFNLITEHNTKWKYTWIAQYSIW